MQTPQVAYEGEPEKLQISQDLLTVEGCRTDNHQDDKDKNWQNFD